MGHETILSVHGLSKRYGSIMAVNDINFSVKKGEVFGLLGPNGAGKTTTIKMLCGLLKADSGKIVFNGISFSEKYDKIKRIIGLCPQEIVIWELLTCLEQLKFIGMSYGLSSEKAGQRGEKLLEVLGLSEKKNKLAKTLSGGMQRRLNIALALVHDPEVIILDEPQAGLDPQSRILVRDFIRQLAKEKTVILTTHDMDEADRLSNRIAIIDHGRILLIDTPEKIKEKSGVGDILQIRVQEEKNNEISNMLSLIPSYVKDKKYVDGLLILGSDNVMALIPTISSILKESNIVIEDMSIRKRTLEDAFIAMTGRGLRQ